uniref:Uncharacterized protein n=1 Tax=Avena sativa TaxID=4498 RepID=A0ACD5Z8I5_AVESA
MAAMLRRFLQQLQPVLAHQAAVRRTPHHSLLHSPFPLTAASPPAPAASPSPSPNLLSRSLLPTSAGGRRGGRPDRRRARRWVLRAVPSAAKQDHVGRVHLVILDVAPRRRRTMVRFRAHWTTTPADGMVLMLVGANVAVYGLWRMADPKFAFSPHVIWLDTYTGGRLHALLTSALSHVDQRFMVNHFMISLDNFKSLRWHTLLTSAFSHKDADHLFYNMFGFYFFGSSIARLFGPGFLLQLYVQGAVLGSTFFLAEMCFLAPRKEGFGGWNTHALGASAAVNATILLYIFLYPTSILYLHFFIPLPAALVGAGLIGVDLWRVKKGQSRVSGSAHLGGAFVVALVFAQMKGWI